MSDGIQKILEFNAATLLSSQFIRFIAKDLKINAPAFPTALMAACMAVTICLTHMVEDLAPLLQLYIPAGVEEKMWNHG